MIISFAWTTPALLAGAKNVTRRTWDPSHARRFKPGDLVQAYDRSPRVGGKPVAVIRIVSVAFEPDANAPDSDYEAEGFAWLAAHPEALPNEPRVAYLETCSLEAFRYWRSLRGESFVVRFELVEVLRRVEIEVSA